MIASNRTSKNKAYQASMIQINFTSHTYYNFYLFEIHFVINKTLSILRFDEILSNVHSPLDLLNYSPENFCKLPVRPHLKRKKVPLERASGNYFTCEKWERILCSKYYKSAHIDEKMKIFLCCFKLVHSENEKNSKKFMKRALIIFCNRVHAKTTF